MNTPRVDAARIDIRQVPPGHCGSSEMWPPPAHKTAWTYSSPVWWGSPKPDRGRRRSAPAHLGRRASEARLDRGRISPALPRSTASPPPTIRPINTGALRDIFIHPIKSCGAVRLSSVYISALGLAGDRLWQVIDADSGRLTQRQHPRLATVRPELLDHGGIRLSAFDMATIDIDPPNSPPITVTTTQLKIPVTAIDAGDAAAQWFTALTGTTARLVTLADGTGSRLPGDLDVFGQNSAFTDAAPVLVTSTSSLDWLLERSAEDITMDRFRPNLVVSGFEPWEEDRWATFRIGEAECLSSIPWPRCPIPQIDQTNAKRHREPALVLRAHRWCTDASALNDPFRPFLEGNALFGIGTAIAPAGVQLHVGDHVKVNATQTPVLSMA